MTILQKLYANNLDNLKEMDKYLEIYNLPKLPQKGIENTKKPITSNKTESVINSHQNLGPGGFIHEF